MVLIIQRIISAKRAAYIAGLIVHSLHFHLHSKHMERSEPEWEDIVEIVEASWIDWVRLHYFHNIIA